MRIRSDSITRCAVRPVTKVSPTSSTRSARVTRRKIAEAVKRAACEPAATPLSIPFLTRTGPASPASASRITSTSPTASGRRNSRSSLRRLKPRTWRASRSRSIVDLVADRPQLRHLGHQLRGRREAFAIAPPRAPPGLPSPPPRLARRRRSRALPSEPPRPDAAAPAGRAPERRAVAAPGRRRRLSLDPRAQRLDPALDRLGDVLVEPGQQAAVDRAYARRARRGCPGR